MEQVPQGARPCLAELKLVEIEQAMSDLCVTTELDESARGTLFQDSLGDRWCQLPAPVRDLHSVQDIESFSGTAEVVRGKSLVARLLAIQFRIGPTSGRRVHAPAS